MLQGITAAITGFISLSPCPRRQVSPIRTHFRRLPLTRHFQGLRPLLLVVLIEWANLNVPLGTLTLPDPLASARTVPKRPEEVALHDQQ